MSDDLFTLDLSGMDLKDLIQVVNEMDSKLNDKIIPKILEEVGDELIDEERRMPQGRAYGYHDTRSHKVLQTGQDTRCKEGRKVLVR